MTKIFSDQDITDACKDVLFVHADAPMTLDIGRAVKAAILEKLADKLKDAERWQAFWDSGLPVCYRGTEYMDKASCDAAIDEAITTKEKTVKCPICDEEVRSTEQAEKWGPEYAHTNCISAYNYGKSDALATLEAVEAMERERCANIVENYNPGGSYHIRTALAAEIRRA